MQFNLDNFIMVIVEMKVCMDFFNKEVMERYVIGLCIEIVLILMLFVVFVKRNNSYNVFDIFSGLGYYMNGKGFLRLVIEDGYKNNVFQLIGKFC